MAYSRRHYTETTACCKDKNPQKKPGSFVYTAILFWYSCRMNSPGFPKIDKTAFTVASLFDQSDEKSYWLSKTPYERLEAVELMRQIIYGYDPSAIRLQRVLEVTGRP
jgi:hypothetical protein